MQRRLLDQHSRRRVRLWWRDARGVSAVEFALFAPVLFFGLLSTVDIGLALYDRMTIDHVLRAGAQSAMMDRGEESVLAIIEATAANNFTVANEGAVSTTGNSLTLSVDRYCACPDNPDTAVVCSTTCTGSVPTSIYYRLSASKTYDGMIIPAMNFAPSMQVQIR